MIIAIDGPAGAGKGTIARHLAHVFNLLHIDSGLFYRVLGKAALDQEIDVTDTDRICQLAENIALKDTYLPDLKQEAIGNMASKVGLISSARDILTKKLQLLTQTIPVPYEGIVMDGRDIGTVVCPNAFCKLYITATPSARQNRRHKEMQTLNLEPAEASKSKADLAHLVHERDDRDQRRKKSPLRPASNSYILDTTFLTVEESCLKAKEIINRTISNEQS